jgi:glycosyltransferase involved in cell wall biosynthesis
MRILLLNQTFYPDVVSSAQHAADLAAGLADAGHEVTVVASRRAYDSPTHLFPARESWHNLSIVRVPSTALGKSALWRRAVDFASFLLACILRLALLPRFDVVIAMTSPPLIAVLAALLVRIKGGVLVSWIMDLNPDEAIAAGALRRDSLIASSLSRLLRFSLSTSSGVVVLDKFMRDRVVSKGIPAPRVALVPPWAHSSVVRYDAWGRDRFRALHLLDRKFVVMYSGNHSPCHPLDTILEAARAMRSEPHVAFVFIGGGSEFRKVGNFAGRHALNNVLCLPYQPLEALADSLSAADLHLVVMGDPFVGLVHPCKIYNILAVGSPCLYIGPLPSHVTEIAQSLPPGSISCAAHGDVTAVMAHIRRAAGDGAHRSPANADLAEQFDASSLVTRLISIIEDAGQVADNRIPVAEFLS